MVIIAIWPRHPARPAMVQDASFYFTFCKVTQGTNHTIQSGIRVLGLLNRTLARSGYRRRISHDKLYSWVTPQATTCLSVGFRHDGDVLTKNAKNGLLYPDSPSSLLKATLIQQDGQTEALQHRQAGYDPYTRDYLITWEVPASVTNYLDCEVRLSKKKDGASVATFRLQ